MRMVSRDRTPEELQPIGIQAPAILYLAALILWACSAKTEIPAPWGESRHETGPILDPDALRGALEWGQVNAQTAEKALDAYYTFGLQHEQFFHRARVRTRWTPVGASRSRAKARFPGAGSGSSGGHPQGPPLVITMIKRGFHKDLVRRSDMSLAQGGQKTYAPSLRRGEPSPVKQEDRIVAYEAEMEGAFSLEGINPRKSVSLEVRLGQGDHLAIDLPLWRLK